MTEFFDEETAAAWSAAEIEAVVKRLKKQGAVKSYTFPQSSFPVPDDDEDSITVPYQIVYRSEASRRPVKFRGQIRLAYEEETDEWTVAWDDALFWPGIEGAVGFKTTSVWPDRANIIDRKGRKVAVGPAESRRYPFGSRGGSTIGHIAPATKEDLKRLPDRYKVGDLVGASGLELGLEDRLAGEPSSKLLLVDAAGKRLKQVGKIEGGKAKPVRITLDMEIQAAAEDAYGSTTGGSVVMEPETGNVLAVVSSSPFDPNNYVGVAGIAPFNRAISGLYPPGSSMKIVTASAAVDAGVVTANTTVTGPENYQGVRNFESGVFGRIPFSTAMQNSVNTAFAQVAEDLGAKDMYKYATAFGFNREPQLPLAVAKSSFPRPQDLSDLMWGSIGQAQVLATPLQMASIGATVANDGVRIEPKFLMDEAEGAPEQPAEEVITKKTAKTITRLMQLVVQSGTGTAANLGSSVPVAGKTGTAEVGPVGDIQNHAWFVCFAPADKPQVAISVVSEFGGTGGSVAAPIARQILQAVLPLL